MTTFFNRQLCLLTIFLIVTCSAKNHEILVSSNTYSPSSLVIEAGDSVTWRNTGGSHNVKANDGSFRCAQGCDAFGGDGNPSFNLWSFTITFRNLGTVNYFCEPHISFGMQGSITIIEPQSTTVHEVYTSTNNDFQPSDLTILRGDVVKFINNGGSHNINSEDNSLICAEACIGDNLNLTTNPTGFPFETYVRFNQVAEIPYFCANHEITGTGGIVRIISDTIFASSFE